MAVSESLCNPPETGDIPADELLLNMLTSLTASATQSLAFAWPCNGFKTNQITWFMNINGVEQDVYFTSP